MKANNDLASPNIPYSIFIIRYVIIFLCLIHFQTY